MLGTPKTRSAAVVALAAVVVLVMAALGACGKGEDRPGSAGSASASGSGVGAGGSGVRQFAKGTETSTVEVTMVDFRFTGAPATTKGGNVLFKARVTQGEHELEVVDANGKVVGDIPQFAPDGGLKEMGLKLAPGTYTMQCLVKEGAKTHKDLGMTAIIAVT
jgi:hypothetical protein